MREGNGLDQCGGSEDGEKKMDSPYSSEKEVQDLLTD